MMADQLSLDRFKTPGNAAVLLQNVMCVVMFCVSLLNLTMGWGDPLFWSNMLTGSSFLHIKPKVLQKEPIKESQAPPVD